MKLQAVEINNFRNIGHAEYQLDRINLWTGPNQTGKTNTILAVYWALSDFLMDGSSNYASFKPIEDPKAEVSVELRFDTFTLKKAFAEKWTKTRGSDELKMEGHTTTYWIDGVKLKISEAKKEIQKHLGIADTDTGAFDLLRALIDPYYFWRACDWKTLRTFIIALCGDVSDEDVFQAEPSLLPIKERLKTDRYDTARTTKFYKQALKQVTEGIKEYEGKIKGLEEIKDPAEEDVALAEKSIAEIDQTIAGLRSENGNARIIGSLQIGIREAEVQLRELEASDRAKAEQENAEVNRKIRDKQEEIRKANSAYDEICMQSVMLDSEISKAKSEKSYGLERRRQDLTEKRERLYKEYDRLISWTAPEGQKCPHCGGILNQDHIDQLIKQNHEQLEDCIREGKLCTAEIDNLGEKIREAETKINGLESERAAKKSEKDNALSDIDRLKRELEKLSSEKVLPVTSDEVLNKRAEIQKLKDQLKAEQMRQLEGEEGINYSIAEMTEKKGMFKQVLNAHAAYQMSCEKIEEIKKSIASSQQSQIELEQKLLMVAKYIQIKLQLFATRIASVFGDRMQFQLIQENIKEGSWNEVCVPKIVDKSTPVDEGSGSEQILTGIYFAECVKKKLNLPDLPYIFDECDKLDGAHLAAIDTNSQILSTIVDDLHYTTITLEARG